MKIVRAKINNILSIEDATIEFDSSGLTLVEGWNHQTQRSNGAGKTAIFNAISFALYDELPRKINKTEILRYGTKSGFCEVELSIANDIVKVRRERPNNVSFWKNDQVLKITQAEFETLIDLSYDEFLTILYLAQGNSNNRFINFNDTKKKDFILALMKMNRFTVCHDLVKQKINDFEKQRDAALIKIEQNKLILAGLQGTLNDYNSTVQDIAMLNDTLHNLELRLQQSTKPVYPDFLELQDLEKKIKDKRAAVSQIQSAIQDNLLSIRQKKEKKRVLCSSTPHNSLNCPHCQGPVRIVGPSIMPDKTLEDKRLAIQAQSDLLDNEIASLEDKGQELQDSIPDLSQLEALEEKIKQRKALIIQDYEEQNEQYANLVGEYRLTKRSIEEKNNQLLKLDSVTNKMQQIQANSDSAQQLIDRLSNEIDMYTALSVMFSPLGAPAYIMDTLIDTLNTRIQQYIDLIWPNSAYRILTQKNTGNKQTTKFSEQLIMNGRECSLGSLSGGEFRALSLIVDFAIFSVINEYFNRQVNPIILDEPFDGLDVAGREVVIELLDKMSADKNIIIIDHATESKALFNKVIKVNCQNGISSISC